MQSVSWLKIVADYLSINRCTYYKKSKISTSQILSCCIFIPPDIIPATDSPEDAMEI